MPDIKSNIRRPPSHILCVAFLVGTTAVWAGAAETRFEAAARFYQQEQWQQAAAAFAVCVDSTSDDPKHVAALFYQGECQMRLGDYSNAGEHYRIVLEKSPEGPYASRALFRVAESSWLAGHPNSAQPLLHKFVHDYPHDALAAYAHTYLGDIALLSGDFQRSIAAYRTVVNSFAHTSQVNVARLGLAKALLAVGRTSEVAVALGRLPKEESPAIAAEALMLLGRSQYEAGKHEEALQTFRRVYRTFPESRHLPNAKLAAGWSLWKLSAFADVQQEVASLVDEPRWKVETQYLLGMTDYGERDWSSAIQRLTQALEESETHPSRDAIVFYLGENCLRDGQFNAAAHWFQVLSEQHRRSPWADDALWGMARVARIQNETSEFQAAVAQLRNSFPKTRYLNLLHQPPSGEEKYLAMPYEDELLDEAIGLERDGRYDAALAAYHELINQHQIGQTHSEALRRTARLHDQLAQYPKASRFYQQFLAQYPDSDHVVEVISAQAWISDRMGKLDAAARGFHKLHENFSQSAQALEATYWLALAAADEKDSTMATSYVDWLLDEFSKKPDSRPTDLWEQTLLLKCQLAASGRRWQEVKDLLTEDVENITEGPRKVRANFWLAESEFRRGRFAEARTAFDHLAGQTTEIIDEPWVAMVPLRRAQLRSRRQQWTEVLKILEPVDQESHDFRLQYEVDYLRGRAYAGRGEMTSARRAYRLVLANEAANNTETAAMAQWMIGETFFHQNDYPRAREAYQRVIDEHSQPEWQARAALQAGKCWELEQRWEKATAFYSAALKKWQGSDSEEQLQARLKWARNQATQRR